MKKKILSVVVLLATSLCVFAQNGVGQWSFMPKAGLNLATLTNDSEAKIRPALTVGGEFGYVASPKMALSFGAMYSQQGCKAIFQGIDGTIKMDYINIPVIASYRATDKLAIKIGLQPGFMINDKVKISGNGVSAEVGLEESYRSIGFDVNINKVDLSIPIGISYDFDNVQVEFRYNAGITNAMTAEGGFSTKNSVFQFTIGYKFGLKK